MNKEGLLSHQLLPVEEVIFTELVAILAADTVILRNHTSFRDELEKGSSGRFPTLLPGALPLAPYDLVRSTMQDWITANEPGSATVGKLADALHSIHNVHLAGVLKEKWNVSTVIIMESSQRSESGYSSLQVVERIQGAEKERLVSTPPETVNEEAFVHGRPDGRGLAKSDNEAKLALREVKESEEQQRPLLNSLGGGERVEVTADGKEGKEQEATEKGSSPVSTKPHAGPKDNIARRCLFVIACFVIILGVIALVGLMIGRRTDSNNITSTTIFPTTNVVTTAIMAKGSCIITFRNKTVMVDICGCTVVHLKTNGVHMFSDHLQSTSAVCREPVETLMIEGHPIGSDIVKLEHLFINLHTLVFQGRFTDVSTEDYDNGWTNESLTSLPIEHLSFVNVTSSKYLHKFLLDRISFPRLKTCSSTCSTSKTEVTFSLISLVSRSPTVVNVTCLGEGCLHLLPLENITGLGRPTLNLDDGYDCP